MTNSLYSPHWKLSDSPASGSGQDGSGDDLFPMEGRDIPDDFANLDQPKFKFLFTIQFFSRDIDLPYSGSDDMHSMAFGIKTASRPKPQVNYQDVNYYNYRTKVATKVDYGTIDITFYDDVRHKAHEIYRQYLEFISPIAKVSKDQADLLMTLDQAASTIGSLTSKYGPFQAIRITHHMLDDYNNTQKVFYDYLNPKIVNFSPDDLDMSQPEVSMMALSFVYDSVNITYATASLDNSEMSMDSTPDNSSDSDNTDNQDDLTSSINYGNQPTTTVSNGSVPASAVSVAGNINIGGGVNIGRSSINLPISTNGKTVINNGN